LHAVHDFAEQLAGLNALSQVTVPDLWQQQAVSALREGKDVVVQAPTGAGKTFIFESWSNQGKPRGQAIYTVPTRALANDKLAEWRARGWQVGIATGDLSDQLDAPVIVATLETQKHRLIRGEGPALLVVDEYQMIGDSDRGLNYEFAIAMAPPRTQLLLLSGSVGNPQDVVKWLRRLGRDALLIKHDQRPVPLDEVYASNLSYHLPAEIHGYWPRLVAKALAEDLGPVLLFAPRRQASEEMAAELARQLPCPNPLLLTPAQRQLVGEHLAKLLKSRVAFHHSGLSYAVRAGVIEPLAKAGQLRAVVATMGLAAGINFSLRSVTLAGESYRRDAAEHPLRADEILQMFGRAGRRGLDEIGYVIVSANGIRLLDSHPCQLHRSGMVDWGALLGVMHAGAQAGRDPFTEAVRVQERLFTSKPIILGVEESLKHPDVPCGLRTDSERARQVKKRLREIRNSQGGWEPYPATQEKCLEEISARPPSTASTSDTPPALIPILALPAAIEKVGNGVPCVVGEQAGWKLHGKLLTVADRLHDGRVNLAKWARRLTNWPSRQAPFELWEQKIQPLLAEKLVQQKTPVLRFTLHGQHVAAVISIARLTLRVPVDQLGVALWRPEEREVLPTSCVGCPQIEVCRRLPSATGTALLWRRLGLVDASGHPTRRGQLVSFFHQGDGLAIAVALEDESYPLDEFVYDLANLDAGFRFAGDDNRWGGRLAIICHQRFGLQSIQGYLENGLPPKYGAGAEQIVAAVHKDPQRKFRWVTTFLGVGDIDRMIIEWRSLLRQIAHAPELDWPRWTALQAMARGILRETESPTLTDLPPLDRAQTRRVDHRLQLRRH
jgi:hypothetical protein